MIEEPIINVEVGLNFLFAEPPSPSEVVDSNEYSDLDSETAAVTCLDPAEPGRYISHLARFPHRHHNTGRHARKAIVTRCATIVYRHSSSPRRGRARDGPGWVASASGLQCRYGRHVAASRATVNDVDWIIDLLSERRAPLVQHAPVFWHPAPDARATHRAFVEYLLSDGGAHAYRTPNAVLVAAPRGDGWLVDDAHVADQHWSEDPDGHELWDLLEADCGGSPVRFVCPTYEDGRAAFAASVGLEVQESWWLQELTSSGGQVGIELELPGAAAVTVGAPPVYAPPGPIMFLPNPTDAVVAVPAAIEKAMELGCAAVVVNQQADDSQLGENLKAAGLRRHCDYFAGRIQRA